MAHLQSLELVVALQDNKQTIHRLAVVILTFYSNNLIYNPAEVYNFNL